jgi:hypothetical protein
VLTDLPVALIGTTAVLFAAHAFRSTRWLDVSLAGLALGLALAAKHSGLIPWLAIGACGTLVALFPQVASSALTRARAFAMTLAVLSIALVVLWGFYGFRYTETTSGEEAFNRPLTLKIEDVQEPLARRTLNTIVGAHLLPRSYVWGLADTIRAGMQGRDQPVFFFGRTYRNRGPSISRPCWQLSCRLGCSRWPWQVFRGF